MMPPHDRPDCRLFRLGYAAAGYVPVIERRILQRKRWEACGSTAVHLTFSSSSCARIHGVELVSIRRFLLALVILGVVATTADLLLLGHYEDTNQQIPLALNALAVAIIAWQLALRSRASVRAFQAIMLAFVLAALVGSYLHYRGNLDFQLEIDPSQSRWELFGKVMRAKAPPALAPGAMAQIGLIGLIFAYRHPSLRRDSDATGD